MFFRHFKRVMLLLLTLAVAIAAARGQQRTSARALGFRVRRWTTEDGLPQNRVACLTQTHDGYLWIGTWAGLARFDGMRFTVFNKFNTPELVQEAITALM